jgi:hypothetical protein
MPKPTNRTRRPTRPAGPPTIEAQLRQAIRSAPDWGALERAFLAVAAAVAEGTLDVQAARRLLVVGRAERLRRDAWEDPTHARG